MTMHHQKIFKLIHRLKALISCLEDQSDLVIHQKIDQFFYMTKSEELKILLAQLEEEKKRLEITNGRLETKYEEIFRQWQKDARLLNTYLISREYV
jgi:hypothetical protein